MIRTSALGVDHACGEAHTQAKGRDGLGFAPTRPRVRRRPQRLSRGAAQATVPHSERRKGGEERNGVHSTTRRREKEERNGVHKSWGEMEERNGVHRERRRRDDGEK